MSTQTLLDDFGLEAVLLDADAQNLGPLAIAGLVLAECCCPGGCWNNCVVGVFSVIQYLEETQGRKMSSQDMTDLATMLKSGVTRAAIDRWVASRFP